MEAGLADEPSSRHAALQISAAFAQLPPLHALDVHVPSWQHPLLPQTLVQPVDVASLSVSVQPKLNAICERPGYPISEYTG